MDIYVCKFFKELFMMFPVIGKFFHFVIVFFRNVKHVFFTFCREGKKVATVKLSSLTFTALFPARTITFCQRTLHHVSSFTQVIKNLFFAYGQANFLSVKIPLTDYASQSRICQEDWRNFKIILLILQKNDTIYQYQSSWKGGGYELELSRRFYI